MARSHRRKRGAQISLDRMKEQEEAQELEARRVAEREAEIMQLEYERKKREEAMDVQVAKRLEVLRVEHEARKLHTTEITRQRTADVNLGVRGDEFLAQNDEPMVEVVKGLHYRGYNTLLAASHKAGKTTLSMNLAAALCDGDPFLGRYAVDFKEGRVGFLNYELYPRQFRTWLRNIGIENIDRVMVQNLRGWRLPFWDDETLYRLAEWLVQNRVKFLIVDPAVRAWRGLVEHESDNVQLSEFFGAIDELKRLGDVSDLVLTTHTPRDDVARARGGGEMEAWPDGLWYLNRRRNDVRVLSIEGRMDEPPLPFELSFDKDTHVLTVGADAHEVSIEQGIERLTVALSKAGGEVTGAREFRKLYIGHKADKIEWEETAADRGQIEIDEGPPKVYRLVEKS